MRPRDQSGSVVEVEAEVFTPLAASIPGARRGVVGQSDVGFTQNGHLAGVLRNALAYG